MTLNNPHFHVITGASGAGKSTLLATLRDLGYSTVPEAGRAVLREQQEVQGGLSPSVDRAAFMQAVLARGLEDYQAARSLRPPVFFDRGVPEWLRLVDADVASIHGSAVDCRYADTVFVAEPWPEIYVADQERRASFERAARSYEPTVSAYVAMGYGTCVIPRVSVRERVAFILASLEAAV
tara:strand:- start:25900 stop:26442 length:543 start_codon:yes stop_codon:yes gene_type:complete